MSGFRFDVDQVDAGRLAGVDTFDAGALAGALLELERAVREGKGRAPRLERKPRRREGATVSDGPATVARSKTA